MRAWIQHFAGKVGDGVSSLFILFYFILHFLFLGGEGGGGRVRRWGYKTGVKGNCRMHAHLSKSSHDISKCYKYLKNNNNNLALKK